MSSFCDIAVYSPRHTQALSAYHAAADPSKNPDKAGLEPCRFEDLRHTAAVQMLEKDGDVNAMSAQLGRSCTAMAKLLYADYLPVKNKNAQAAEAKETTNAELQKAADTLGATFQF